MKILATVILVPAVLLSSGCTALAIMQEKQKFPRDTAVIIQGNEYLINHTKCAEILSISDDGELDCYAPNGSQSAPVTPAFDSQVDITEENWGYWGSPAHQAFLFDYFNMGGMERNAEAIAQQLIGTYQITKSITDTLDASKKMDQDSAKMELEGVGAWVKGGQSAWEAHSARKIQWHLDNAQYFTNKMFETPRY